MENNTPDNKKPVNPTIRPDREHQRITPPNGQGTQETGNEKKEEGPAEENTKPATDENPAAGKE